MESVFRMENEKVPPKTEGLVSRMALNDNKAGMEGLDRDKINKIIMEISKVDTVIQSEFRVNNQCCSFIHVTANYALLFPDMSCESSTMSNGQKLILGAF